MTKTKSHSRYNFKSKKVNKLKVSGKQKKSRNKSKKYKLFGGVNIDDLNKNILQKPKIFKKYFELFAKDFSKKLRVHYNVKRNEITFDTSIFHEDVEHKCDEVVPANFNENFNKNACDLFFINLYMLIKNKNLDIMQLSEFFTFKKTEGKTTIRIKKFDETELLKKIEQYTKDLKKTQITKHQQIHQVLYRVINHLKICLYMHSQHI
jgi:hypothetical protein